MSYQLCTFWTCLKPYICISSIYVYSVWRHTTSLREISCDLITQPLSQRPIQGTKAFVLHRLLHQLDQVIYLVGSRFTELMRPYGPTGCSVVSLPSSMLHPNFTNAAGHQFGIVFSESSLNPILCCTGLQACSCRSTSLITGKPVDLSAHGTLAVLLTQNGIDWNPFKWRALGICSWTFLTLLNAAKVTWTWLGSLAQCYICCLATVGRPNLIAPVHVKRGIPLSGAPNALARSCSCTERLCKR